MLDLYTRQKINEYVDRLVAEEQQKKKNNKMLNKRRWKKARRNKVEKDLLYDYGLWL